MASAVVFIAFFVGLVLGAVLVWLFLSRRQTEFANMKRQLSETFSSLASDTLQKSHASFFEVAKNSFDNWHASSQVDLSHRQKAINELVQPIKASLDKVDTRIRELETAREGAYRGLFEQVKSLVEAQDILRRETQNLSRALHAPGQRGRWGEMQLRRVVELAGMLPYCDFMEQQTWSTDDNNIRPDLVVKLPGDKLIIVDAKAPLDACLRAMDAQTEDERQVFLVEHAAQLRRHIQALSKKAYYKQIEQSPEFVVLFLPGETFFSQALASDPSLMEWSTQLGVILATPVTLIALLKACAYGWNQHALTENALKISELSHKLYERLTKMALNFSRLGKNLRTAVDSYNDTLASYESRVLVSARKLRDFGVSTSPIARLEPIEKSARQVLGERDEEEGLSVENEP